MTTNSPYPNRIIKITTCPTCGKETDAIRPTSLPNSYFIEKGATLHSDGKCIVKQPKPCLPNCKD